MKLSVIIPAYNERAVIRYTIDRISSYLHQQLPGQYEIIVVNDGSTDATAEILSAEPAIRTITLSRNQGKGAAVKAGVLVSRGDLILFTDADNSTDISQLNNFLSLAGSRKIIIGSRSINGATITVSQSWLKQSLGRLGNLLIRLFLLPGIKDTQCGFKLFPAEARELFLLQRRADWAFDFELLFIARKHGYQIIEVPVTWVNRRDSRVKPLSYLTTLLAIFSVQYNYWTGRYKI